MGIVQTYAYQNLILEQLNNFLPGLIICLPQNKFEINDYYYYFKFRFKIYFKKSIFLIFIVFCMFQRPLFLYS